MQARSRDTRAITDLGLVMVGAGVGAYGFGELSAGKSSAKEPTKVELADLEQGGAPANNHVVIGPHLSFYDGAIYEYRAGRTWAGDPMEAGPESALNYVLYPVFSLPHPFTKAIQDFERQHGPIQDLSDGIPMPTPESCTVLVRSRQFSRIKDIPSEAVRRESLQGLLIRRDNGRPSELRSGERELLVQRFPKVDWSRVVILEEGRRPSSAGFSYALITLGLLAVVTPIGLMIARRGGHWGALRPPPSPR